MNKQSWLLNLSLLKTHPAFRAVFLARFISIVSLGCLLYTSSLWPQQCALPAGWDVVCQPQSQASCQQWLEAHWRTLTPSNFTQLQEAQ